LRAEKGAARRRACRPSSSPCLRCPSSLSDRSTQGGRAALCALPAEDRRFSRWTCLRTKTVRRMAMPPQVASIDSCNACYVPQLLGLDSRDWPMVRTWKVGSSILYSSLRTASRRSSRMCLSAAVRCVELNAVDWTMSKSKIPRHTPVDRWLKRREPDYAETAVLQHQSFDCTFCCSSNPSLVMIVCDTV
jgi:hypothetical protein